eukprot:2122401-Amphidinium_carterae.1
MYGLDHGVSTRVEISDPDLNHTVGMHNAAHVPGVQWNKRKRSAPRSISSLTDTEVMETVFDQSLPPSETHLHPGLRLGHTGLSHGSIGGMQFPEAGLLSFLRREYPELVKTYECQPSPLRTQIKHLVKFGQQTYEVPRGMLLRLMVAIMALIMNSLKMDELSTAS